MADDASEAEGVNTRAELAATAAVLRDRINLAHMLAGSDDRRPGHDVDRPDRRAGARLHHPALHRPARRDARRAGRRGRAARRRRGLGDRPRTRWSAPSVTFAPERCWRPARRQARSWRSRTRTSGNGRRCPTSPTSETRRSARTRTSRRATSPSTSPISPASPRAGRRSGATSGPESTMRSSRQWRSATTRGSARARSITEDVPAESLAVARARQENKEGWVRTKAGAGAGK